MTSQPGQQTITMYILPNIARSTDNQIMKLGELMEYNEKHFSLKIMQKMRQED